MPESKSPSYTKSIEIIDILLGIIIISVSIIFLLNYNSLKIIISEDILGWGLIGLFAITTILEFIPQIINPYVGLIVAMASGLSIHWLILAACAGSVLGSWIGFEFGRSYGFRIIRRVFNQERIDKAVIFWRKYGYVFVTFTAITPLPYLPMVFGSLKMTRKNFLIFGVIPRILSLVVVGYGVYLGFF